MRIKNYYLKFLLAAVLLLVANIGFAQQSTLPNPSLPLGTGHKSYAVDTSSDSNNPTLNDQPNGTVGSTYTWSVENMFGTSAETFPTGGRYNDNDSDNKATINWSNYPPGDYIVKVIENNAGCPSAEVAFTVTITSVNATGLVNWFNPNGDIICKGGTVTFKVTGANPNAVLHYTISNVVESVRTVTVDGDGNATIVVTHDNSNNASIEIILEKLVLNGTDILYIDPKPSDTATINIIVTSPITALD